MSVLVAFFPINPFGFILNLVLLVCLRRTLSTCDVINTWTVKGQTGHSGNAARCEGSVAWLGFYSVLVMF